MISRRKFLTMAGLTLIGGAATAYFGHSMRSEPETLYVTFTGKSLKPGALAEITMPFDARLVGTKALTQDTAIHVLADGETVSEGRLVNKEQRLQVRLAECPDNLKECAVELYFQRTGLLA